MGVVLGYECANGTELNLTELNLGGDVKTSVAKKQTAVHSSSIGTDSAAGLHHTGTAQDTEIFIADFRNVNHGWKKVVLSRRRSVGAAHVFCHGDTGIHQTELLRKKIVQFLLGGTATGLTALATLGRTLLLLLVHTVLVDVVQVLLFQPLALAFSLGVLHYLVEALDIVRRDAVLFKLFGTDWCCSGVTHGWNCFWRLARIGDFWIVRIGCCTCNNAKG